MKILVEIDMGENWSKEEILKDLVEEGYAVVDEAYLERDYVDDSFYRFKFVGVVEE